MRRTILAGAVLVLVALAAPPPAAAQVPLLDAIERGLWLFGGRPPAAYAPPPVYDGPPPTMARRPTTGRPATTLRRSWWRRGTTAPAIASRTGSSGENTTAGIAAATIGTMTE